MTEHKELKKWIEDTAKLCRPEDIVWIGGSDKQRRELEAESVAAGEIIPLNEKRLPGCFLHRTAINDVARTEGLTFICTPTRSEAGPTNNWMSPRQAYRRGQDIFSASMKGRTMYVIPFSMGPIGSPFSKIGVELTDSIYVVLNMLIMTRVGKKVLAQLGSKSEFTKCLHSKADLNIDRRLILHFPQDNTIWSVGSGYGGNVLLGKKCLALRIASYKAEKEGWMAEHMLIMGVEQPNGRIYYIAAAFPSACGKTNLAMMIPPEGLKRKGYKIWTVGDDIAWMRISNDGGLWAINPEAGFFGVAPGTNSKTNLNAMVTVCKNTIFTNVLLKPDGTVWWEGGDEPPPTKGIDWRGLSWKPGMVDGDGKPLKGAHPNSRFTAPAKQCPSISDKLDDHNGVPISAIIFGGRRAHLAPLVYEAFNWQHGVFVGATMASERTAAQYGRLGEVRRDPMAMLPFCGYNMAKYFKHWLKIGKRLKRQPKIFHVNWFRQDRHGKFLWPGYGENLRILEWIIRRCNNEVEARRTPIGYIPYKDDIDLTGLHIERDRLRELFFIDEKEWKEELQSQGKFLAKFKNELPRGIKSEYVALERRLR